MYIHELFDDIFFVNDNYYNVLTALVEHSGNHQEEDTPLTRVQADTRACVS